MNILFLISGVITSILLYIPVYRVLEKKNRHVIRVQDKIIEARDKELNELKDRHKKLFDNSLELINSNEGLIRECNELSTKLLIETNKRVILEQDNKNPNPKT
jgi:hypothetical protein